MLWKVTCIFDVIRVERFTVKQLVLIKDLTVKSFMENWCLAPAKVVEDQEWADRLLSVCPSSSLSTVWPIRREVPAGSLGQAVQRIVCENPGIRSGSQREIAARGSWDSS
jgi:hypothetical protein